MNLIVEGFGDYVHMVYMLTDPKLIDHVSKLQLDLTIPHRCHYVGQTESTAKNK